MTGQMTIWDLIPRSLEEISEEEMVQRVGDALGVKFVWDKFFEDYRAKVGKSTLMIHYSHYNGVYNNALFISCGIDSGPPHSTGAGAPRDSIEEAIEWFERRRK